MENATHELILKPLHHYLGNNSSVPPSETPNVSCVHTFSSALAAMRASERACVRALGTINITTCQLEGQRGQGLGIKGEDESVRRYVSAVVALYEAIGSSAFGVLLVLVL